MLFRSSRATDEKRIQDFVIDRRGSVYAGVLRRLDRTHLRLDIDALLQVRPIKIMYVRGVRLADSTRSKTQKWKGSVLVYLNCRDGSIVKGHIEKIRFNRWYIRPQWDKESLIEVSLDEISLVQIQGGKVQYLSQLQPVSVDEKTVLAPPQPYQMDRSSQKDKLSIAGRRYPWGIGVHANSSLTFEINGRYKEFRSDIGIDTGMRDRGSVVFSVLGDGKKIYESPVVKGSDSAPRKINVSVAGVQKLTLRVTDAGDLDLGDVANWASARVLRIPGPRVKKKEGTAKKPDTGKEKSGKEQP